MEYVKQIIQDLLTMVYQYSGISVICLVLFILVWKLAEECSWKSIWLRFRALLEECIWRKLFSCPLHNICSSENHI